MTPTNRHEVQPQLSHAELRKAQRTATAISSVLISAMMMLAAYGFTEVARSFDWPITARVFVPFIFLAALEILYAKEIEKRILDDFGTSGYFRLAEILLLAIFLRAGLLLFGSAGGQWAVFLQKLSEPMSAWFAPEYTVSLFILVLIWGFMLLSYRDMTLLYNLEEFTDWNQIGKQQADLVKKRTAFLNRFIFLGIAMLIGMIFSAGFWEQEGGIRFTFNGEPLTMVLVVMGYFLLLLLLMSQTQLARLRTRWWLNDSAVNPRVQSDWMRVSLAFFMVAALVALLSPTGFAESVFKVLQSILLFLMTVAQFIVAIIFVPISMLLGLLFSTQQQTEGDALPAEVPQTLEETAQQLTSQPPAWLDTASDVVVWLLLGGVIVFALAQYLRQDRSLAADIAALFQRIRTFIRDAWASLRGGVEDITANIQRRRRMRRADQSEGHPATVEPGENLRLRLGQPRKDIFLVYRRLLDRGREIGLGRKTSQTPLQYEETLDTEVDIEAIEPLHHLTKAFDDARYSQRELTQDEADQMAEEWEAVRKGMKKEE